jgi:hypothetical protein
MEGFWAYDQCVRDRLPILLEFLVERSETQIAIKSETKDGELDHRKRMVHVFPYPPWLTNDLLIAFSV